MRNVFALVCLLGLITSGCGKGPGTPVPDPTPTEGATPPPEGAHLTADHSVTERVCSVAISIFADDPASGALTATSYPCDTGMVGYRWENTVAIWFMVYTDDQTVWECHFMRVADPY
jgi:hypothetical protein